MFQISSARTITVISQFVDTVNHSSYALCNLPRVCSFNKMAAEYESSASGSSASSRKKAVLLEEL